MYHPNFAQPAEPPQVASGRQLPAREDQCWVGVQGRHTHQGPPLRSVRPSEPNTSFHLYGILCRLCAFRLRLRAPMYRSGIVSREQNRSSCAMCFPLCALLHRCHASGAVRPKHALGRSHEPFCVCVCLSLSFSFAPSAYAFSSSASQLHVPSCTMLSSLARSVATRSSRASLAAVTGSPAPAARSYSSTLLRAPQLAAAAPSATRASQLHSSSRLARDDAAATEAPPQPQAGGLENQGQEAVPSPMTEQARRSDDIDVCAVVSPP